MVEGVGGGVGVQTMTNDLPRHRHCRRYPARGVAQNRGRTVGELADTHCWVRITNCSKTRLIPLSCPAFPSSPFSLIRSICIVKTIHINHNNFRGQNRINLSAARYNSVH